MKSLIATVILAASLAGAVCPEDGGNAYFTGETRTSSSGQLLYLYKCLTYGHTFWARP